MPGRRELAQVEERISRMTDGELLEMHRHPEDYEPWALELGRAELNRRILKARKVQASRLSYNCAQALANASGAISEGSTVRLDSHSLTLSVEIDRVLKHPTDAKTLAAIGVAWDINDDPVPALTAGTVGFGTTTEEAMMNAVEDWVRLIGLPVVAALSGKAADLQFGAFAVYPSPIAIRGPKPEHLDRLHEAFFARVGSALPGILSESILHSVIVMVQWPADRGPEADFLVDGKPSDQLKRLALGVEWPLGRSSSFLKQCYVLAPAATRDRAN